MCYAFSVATLIDQYRFSHGDKDFQHITSPLLLTLKTIENFHDLGSTFSGGKVEHAFFTAQHFGSCSAKIISDHLGPYGIDFLLKNLQVFQQKFIQHKESRTLISEKIYQFLKNSGVDAQALPSTSEIEKNILLGPDVFISKTLLKFCTENKKLPRLPDLKLLFQPQVTQEQLLNRIQTLLSMQTPLGINFCSNVVTDSTYAGGLQGEHWFCKDFLNHSALLVGREMRNGKCQFLIQDTGCKGYEKNNFFCQQGQYWLGADQLLKNTHGIFWLD